MTDAELCNQATAAPTAINDSLIAIIGNKLNVADYEPGGPGGTPEDVDVVEINANTSLGSSAFGRVHILKGTDFDFTIDLPTAVGNKGSAVVLKGAHNFTKIATIGGVSGQLIDGENDRKMSACGLLVLVSDDVNWHVVNETGSWIPFLPILTGFSTAGDPGFLRTDYFRMGKLVTYRIISNVVGQSWSGVKTLAGPFIAAELSFGLCSLINNGGTIQPYPGVCATRMGSATIDVYRTADLGATVWSGTPTTNASCRYNLMITFRIQ